MTLTFYPWNPCLNVHLLRWYHSAPPRHCNWANTFSAGVHSPTFILRTDSCAKIALLCYHCNDISTKGPTLLPDCLTWHHWTTPSFWLLVSSVSATDAISARRYQAAVFSSSERSLSFPLPPTVRCLPWCFHPRLPAYKLFRENTGGQGSIGSKDRGGGKPLPSGQRDGNIIIIPTAIGTVPLGNP